MSRPLLVLFPLFLGLPLVAQIAAPRPIPIPQSAPAQSANDQSNASADPAKLVAQLREKVDAGDKDAAFQLGVLTLIGQSVPQDGAQAEALFKKTDMTPTRDCFVAEAWMETSLPGRIEAAKRWVNAADSGCGWRAMAQWYATPALGPDPLKQAEYLKKGLAAKDDDYRTGMRGELGDLILKGASVEATPAERTAWLGDAARTRLGLAELSIGMYAAQHPEDSNSPAEALEWIRHAARYQIPNALIAVGQGAMSRDISDLSFGEGLALFDIGARQSISAPGLEMQRRQLEPAQQQDLDDHEAYWRHVASETGGFYPKQDPLRFAAPVDMDALTKLATPENPDAQLRLAYVYESKGEPDKAEAIYRQVAENGPGRLWLGVADTVAQTKKWARARESYENAAAAGSRKACEQIATIDADGLAGRKDPVGGYLWLLRSETKNTALLAERKKLLTADQIKSVQLSQAEWLLAHQDHWKGDIKAAQELVGKSQPLTFTIRGGAGPLAPRPPAEEFRAKAIAGDKEAAFQYALDLLHGRATDKPAATAVERFAAMGPQDAAHLADIALAWEGSGAFDPETGRKYAMKWWELVGGSRGPYELGLMYYGKADGTVETSDEKIGVEYWQKAVAAGDERWARLARMKLGYCVVKGWSTGDKAKDAAWAHELAMEMLAKEFYEVAGEYSYGRELQHDELTYLRLAERAAIYNSDNAQSQMAQSIINGKWKQRDNIDAYAWMKVHTVKQDTGDRQQVEVAEQNPGLKHKIEERFAQLVQTRAESGAFYPQDDPLRTAEVGDVEARAKTQDPEAEFRLAALLEKRAAEADLDRALALYHDLWARAGQQVRLNWGRSLMYGTDGVKRDDIGAEKFLWDAANYGSKEACRLLAVIYGEGRGFKPDPAAAETWRELAGDKTDASTLTEEQKKTVADKVAEWKGKHGNW